MFACLIAAILIGIAAPLSAQETSEPKIGLGFAAGSPGKTVTIPFSLEGAGGQNVGRIVSRIRFPANHVSFVRLERAGLLDEAIEMVAEVRDADAEASAPQTTGVEKVLDLRISSTREPTALTDGILGYLVFRIEPKTVVEKTPEVVLAAESRIFAHKTTDKDTPLAVVSAQGQILLETPDVPIIACFFYMH